MPGESAPSPTLEERVLIRLGYTGVLDTPVEPGSSIRGRNFLDAYSQTPAGQQHRQETEELLEGFLDMPESDPDYEATRAYILPFIEARFGPLAPGDK